MIARRVAVVVRNAWGSLTTRRSALPSRPDVLDHVLGLRHAAEHAIDDAEQARPCSLKRGESVVRGRRIVAHGRMLTHQCDAGESTCLTLYDEALLTVTSEQQAAAAMVQAARAIAANTPVQLAAARQSEAQAAARYQAGLASIVEVADAQSLLAQAELQDQLARIDVWRARLAQSVAQGTLTPFLSLVNPSAGAR